MIHSNDHVSIAMLDYGAILLSVVMEDKNGKPEVRNGSTSIIDRR